MKQKEAVKIFLQIISECEKAHQHECKECSFSVQFCGRKVCMFNHLHDDFFKKCARSYYDNYLVLQEEK